MVKSDWLPLRSDRYNPMKLLKHLLSVSALLLALAAHAEKITIAAAADLKFAMDEIVTHFRKTSAGDALDVIYGSSGKFHTQIQQGAPYDLFFSADIGFPRELAKAGLAAGEVKPYALGRIVLWSTSLDASKMTLASLTDPKITRIAIANPKHAPYGKRAEEALRASGVWDKIEAQAGLWREHRPYRPVCADRQCPGWHHRAGPGGQPRAGQQGWLLAGARQAACPAGARLHHHPRAQVTPWPSVLPTTWAGAAARAVMTKYGFVLPGEVVNK
jgi:molybdate transport system substrate-binding protein